MDEFEKRWADLHTRFMVEDVEADAMNFAKDLITAHRALLEANARLTAERDRMREALKAAPPIANCNTPGYHDWMKLRNAAITGEGQT